MLIPVCDRPPISTAAIVAKVHERAFPVLDLGETVRLPASAIRAEPRHRLTNKAPDLSIARARLASIVSDATAELERYSRFFAGWDGYAAEPIAPIAIATAGLLINELAEVGLVLRHVTDIIPGPAPDGSLDLEFRADNRRLIITIYPSDAPNEIEIRTFRTDGVTSEEKNDLGPDALVDDFRWLVA